MLRHAHLCPLLKKATRPALLVRPEARAGGGGLYCEGRREKCEGGERETRNCVRGCFARGGRAGRRVRWRAHAREDGSFFFVARLLPTHRRARDRCASAAGDDCGMTSCFLERPVVEVGEVGGQKNNSPTRPNAAFHVHYPLFNPGPPRFRPFQDIVL